MSVRTEESVPAPGNDLAGVESLFEQARRSLILVPLKEILPLVASPLKKWDKLQELLADNESRFAIEILGKSQDNARIYELTRMYGECFCREGDSAKMKLWSETVPVPKRDRKALLDQLHSFHSKGEDETFSAMITVNKSPKAAAAAKKVKAAITFTFGKDGRLDIRLLAVLSGYRRHGFMSFLLEFVFLAQTARMRKETSFERSNTGVKGPPKTMATIHAILSEKDPSLIFFHAMGFEVETKDLTPVAVDSNAETEVPIGPKDLELSFPPHPKESFKFHRAVLIRMLWTSAPSNVPKLLKAAEQSDVVHCGCGKAFNKEHMLDCFIICYSCLKLTHRQCCHTLMGFHAIEEYATRTISVVDLNHLKEAYAPLFRDATEMAHPQVTMCTRCANANYSCPGKLCALQQWANSSIGPFLDQMQATVPTKDSLGIHHFYCHSRLTSISTHHRCHACNHPVHVECSVSIPKTYGRISSGENGDTTGVIYCANCFGRTIQNSTESGALYNRWLPSRDMWQNGATMFEFPFPIKRQHLVEELHKAQEIASSPFPPGCPLVASSIPLFPCGSAESIDLNTEELLIESIKWNNHALKQFCRYPDQQHIARLAREDMDFLEGKEVGLSPNLVDFVIELFPHAHGTGAVNSVRCLPLSFTMSVFEAFRVDGPEGKFRQWCKDNKSWLIDELLTPQVVLLPFVHYRVNDFALAVVVNQNRSTQQPMLTIVEYTEKSPYSETRVNREAIPMISHLLNVLWELKEKVPGKGAATDRDDGCPVSWPPEQFARPIGDQRLQAGLLLCCDLAKYLQGNTRKRGIVAENGRDYPGDLQLVSDFVKSVIKHLCSHLQSSFADLYVFKIGKWLGETNHITIKDGVVESSVELLRTKHNKKHDGDLPSEYIMVYQHLAVEVAKKCRDSALFSEPQVTSLLPGMPQRQCAKCNRIFPQAREKYIPTPSHLESWAKGLVASADDVLTSGREKLDEKIGFHINLSSCCVDEMRTLLCPSLTWERQLVLQVVQLFLHDHNVPDNTVVLLVDTGNPEDLGNIAARSENTRLICVYFDAQVVDDEESISGNYTPSGHFSVFDVRRDEKLVVVYDGFDRLLHKERNPVFEGVKTQVCDDNGLRNGSFDVLCRLGLIEVKGKTSPTNYVILKQKVTPGMNKASTKWQVISAVKLDGKVLKQCDSYSCGPITVLHVLSLLRPELTERLFGEDPTNKEEASPKMMLSSLDVVKFLKKWIRTCVTHHAMADAMPTFPDATSRDEDDNLKQPARAAREASSHAREGNNSTHEKNRSEHSVPKPLPSPPSTITDGSTQENETNGRDHHDNSLACTSPSENTNPPPPGTTSPSSGAKSLIYFSRSLANTNLEKTAVVPTDGARMPNGQAARSTPVANPAATNLEEIAAVLTDGASMPDEHAAPAPAVDGTSSDGGGLPRVEIGHWMSESATDGPRFAELIRNVNELVARIGESPQIFSDATESNFNLPDSLSMMAASSCQIKYVNELVLQALSSPSVAFSDTNLGTAIREYFFPARSAGGTRIDDISGPNAGKVLERMCSPSPQVAGDSNNSHSDAPQDLPPINKDRVWKKVSFKTTPNVLSLFDHQSLVFSCPNNRVVCSPVPGAAPKVNRNVDCCRVFPVEYLSQSIPSEGAKLATRCTIASLRTNPMAKLATGCTIASLPTKLSSIRSKPTVLEPAHPGKPASPGISSMLPNPNNEHPGRGDAYPHTIQEQEQTEKYFYTGDIQGPGILGTLAGSTEAGHFEQCIAQTPYHAWAYVVTGAPTDGTVDAQQKCASVLPQLTHLQRYSESSEPSPLFAKNISLVLVRRLVGLLDKSGRRADVVGQRAAAKWPTDECAQVLHLLAEVFDIVEMDFGNLSTLQDWHNLYVHLCQRSFPVRTKAPPVVVFSELVHRTIVLFQALCPIRLAFLDGQARIISVSFFLRQLIPSVPYPGRCLLPMSQLLYNGNFELRWSTTATATDASCVLYLSNNTDTAAIVSSSIILDLNTISRQLRASSDHAARTSLSDAIGNLVMGLSGRALRQSSEKEDDSAMLLKDLRSYVSQIKLTVTRHILEYYESSGLSSLLLNDHKKFLDKAVSDSKANTSAKSKLFPMLYPLQNRPSETNILINTLVAMTADEKSRDLLQECVNKKWTVVLQEMEASLYDARTIVTAAPPGQPPTLPPFYRILIPRDLLPPLQKRKSWLQPDVYLFASFYGSLSFLCESCWYEINPAELRPSFVNDKFLMIGTMFIGLTQQMLQLHCKYGMLLPVPKAMMSPEETPQEDPEGADGPKGAEGPEGAEGRLCHLYELLVPEPVQPPLQPLSEVEIYARIGGFSAPTIPIAADSPHGWTNYPIMIWVIMFLAEKKVITIVPSPVLAKACDAVSVEMSNNALHVETFAPKFRFGEAERSLHDSVEFLLLELHKEEHKGLRKTVNDALSRVSKLNVYSDLYDCYRLGSREPLGNKLRTGMWGEPQEGDYQGPHRSTQQPAIDTVAHPFASNGVADVRTSGTPYPTTDTIVTQSPTRATLDHDDLGAIDNREGLQNIDTAFVESVLNGSDDEDDDPVESPMVEQEETRDKTKKRIHRHVEDDDHSEQLAKSTPQEHHHFLRKKQRPDVAQRQSTGSSRKPARRMRNNTARHGAKKRQLDESAHRICQKGKYGGKVPRCDLRVNETSGEAREDDTQTEDIGVGSAAEELMGGTLQQASAEDGSEMSVAMMDETDEVYVPSVHLTLPPEGCTVVEPFWTADDPPYNSTWASVGLYIGQLEGAVRYRISKLIFLLIAESFIETRNMQHQDAMGSILTEPLGCIPSLPQFQGVIGQLGTVIVDTVHSLCNTCDSLSPSQRATAIQRPTFPPSPDDTFVSYLVRVVENDYIRKETSSNPPQTVAPPGEQVLRDHLQVWEGLPPLLQVDYPVGLPATLHKVKLKVMFDLLCLRYFTARRMALNTDFFLLMFGNAAVFPRESFRFEYWLRKFNIVMYHLEAIGPEALMPLDAIQLSTGVFEYLEQQIRLMAGNLLLFPSCTPTQNPPHPQRRNARTPSRSIEMEPEDLKVIRSLFFRPDGTLRIDNADAFDLDQNYSDEIAVKDLVQPLPHLALLMHDDEEPSSVRGQLVSKLHSLGVLDLTRENATDILFLIGSTATSFHMVDTINPITRDGHSPSVLLIRFLLPTDDDSSVVEALAASLKIGHQYYYRVKMQETLPQVLFQYSRSSANLAVISSVFIVTEPRREMSCPLSPIADPHTPRNLASILALGEMADPLENSGLPLSNLTTLCPYP